MPFRPGKRFAASMARSGRDAASPLAMQPAWAPFSRRMRVSLRVSISAIATTPPRTRNSGSDSVARQFECSSGRLRITSPAAWIEFDSRSSAFVPVLPMWG